MNTDKIIFYATKKHVNRMVNLMSLKFKKNTGMSDYEFKKLKFYFQMDLQRLVTDLVYKDIEELNSRFQSKEVRKLPATKSQNKQLPDPSESNVVKQESSSVIINNELNKFKQMLDSKIRSVMMFPYFVITLASRDQSKAMGFATKGIKELFDEVNHLMIYKKIIDRKGSAREELVKDLLIAIDRLKKTPGKLTMGKIAKLVTASEKRTTLYSMMETHHLKFDDDFNVIDKKTKKPFEFS